MSKELTEKWRNGTLPNGAYYVKTRSWSYEDRWSNSYRIDIYENGFWGSDYKYPIVEVLAKVPTYEIWFKSEHTLRRCKRWINMMCVGGPATDEKKKLLEQIEECLRGLR